VYNVEFIVLLCFLFLPVQVSRLDVSTLLQEVS